MSTVTEQAARWFTRLRQPQQDENLQSQFERWLWADPAHARAYQAVCRAWDGLDSDQELARLALAADHQRQARRRAVRHIATGALGAVALGGITWHWLSGGSVQWQGQWQTLAAQTTRLALPDGSVAMLGPASQAQAAYAQDSRSVTLLQGAIALDVMRDAARPFVVRTGLADVTVLGTRFMVDRLTPDHLRVSLAQGSVSVTRHTSRWLGLLRNNDRPWVMTAGQVLDIRPDGITLANIPVDDAYAWQHGAMVFTGAGLQEIAAMLSRYTDVPVVAPQGDGVGPHAPRIVATVRQTDIDAFLASLPDLAPVQVQRQNDTVQLLPR